MKFFMGFIGFNNVIMTLLALPIFHITGLEKFEWPPSGSVWLMMTVYAIQGFTMEFSWAVATVNLGPIGAITIYTLCTFPLSVWYDVFVVKEPVKISNWYIVSICILVLAFVAVTV